MSKAVPTTWAANFAIEHDLRLIYETPLPGNVPAYKYEDDDGDQVVVLDSVLPPERQHFSLAHETAHILLGHRDEISEEEESEADQLASELLLPEAPFSENAHLTLRELKELFPHASFEAIARRRLQFISAALTIVDNMKLTRRLMSDDFQAPPRPVTPEWKAIQRSYEEHTDIEQIRGGLLFRTTYVDDRRGVARVLLRVEEA